jgi:hypothetical protein
VGSGGASHRDRTHSDLEGAGVVVDVANAPVWQDSAVMDFLTSTRNSLAAEAAAGV